MYVPCNVARVRVRLAPELTFVLALLASLDNYERAKVADALESDFPNEKSEVWFKYNNPIEVKLACNLLCKMPAQALKLFFDINSPEFVQFVAACTSIPDLQADPYLHGAGLHLHPTGGKLDMHLDYSIHPVSGKERRVNLIIYLNKNWKPEYGGDIELWDDKFTHCVKKVNPTFNTAVLFQTSDLSYHGLPDPIRCPVNEGRKSVAVYYVSNPRPNIVHRPKARFFGRPSDPASDFLERLRLIRVERRITESDLVGWSEEQARLEALGFAAPHL